MALPKSPEMVNGEMLTRKDACKKYGIHPNTLRSRIYKGCTLEEAVNRTGIKHARIPGKKRFGSLTTTGIKINGRKGGNTKYEVNCDCGRSLYVLGISLRNGAKLTCNLPGCELSSRQHHKLSNRSEYKIWVGMIARCHNQNNPNYEYYGGRGIKVCLRWRKSFQHFFSDMGARPHPKLTLERLDNDGDYDPLNCKWCDRKVQANNRRTVNPLQKEIKKLKHILEKNGIQY